MKKPDPILIHPDDGTIELANRLGRLRAAKYANASDRYRRGLSSNAMERGVLGEWVFADHMNRQIGTKLLQIDQNIYGNGDGGIDFKVYGRTIDTKSAASDGTMQIRRLDRAGKFFDPKADIYVAVRVERDMRMVTLFGWVKRCVVMGNATTMRSPVADHMNLELEPSRLLPLNRLASLIQSWAALEGVRR